MAATHFWGPNILRVLNFCGLNNVWGKQILNLINFWGSFNFGYHSFLGFKKTFWQSTKFGYQRVWRVIHFRGSNFVLLKQFFDQRKLSVNKISVRNFFSKEKLLVNKKFGQRNDGQNIFQSIYFFLSNYFQLNIFNRNN